MSKDARCLPELLTNGRLDPDPADPRRLILLAVSDNGVDDPPTTPARS
jgi:hypothetical protein